MQYHRNYTIFANNLQHFLPLLSANSIANGNCKLNTNCMFQLKGINWRTMLTAQDARVFAGDAGKELI